jgi:hypothetical protein
MKKLFFAIILGIFLINFISATTCTMSGYSICEENTYTYGSATAYAKVYWRLVDEKGSVVAWGGKAVGNLYLEIGGSGDKFYLYKNIGSWDSVVCTETGCNGEQISQGKILLATLGQTYTTCLAPVVWDYNEASNGDWAWVYTARGYVGTTSCFSNKVVTCTSSSHCSSGQVCTNNECVLAETQQTYYRFSNNICSSVSILPSQKTSNDYSTLAECQSHIIVEEEGCTTNPQCLYNQICNSGDCTDLQCGTNEIADNHQCVAQEENTDSSSLIYGIIGIAILFILVITAMILSIRKKRGKRRK